MLMFLVKKIRTSLQVVWLTCFWNIWKEINNRIFTFKETLIEVLFDKMNEIIIVIVVEE
jgi:hypothetical protein